MKGQTPFQEGMAKPLLGLIISLLLMIFSILLGHQFWIVLLVIFFEIVAGFGFGVTNEISGITYIIGIVLMLLIAGGAIGNISMEPIAGASISIDATLIGLALKNIKGDALLYVLGFLLIILLILIIWFIPIYSSETKTSTTSTSSTSTSTTSISTTTSINTSTTTTIPPYTGCPTEPPTKNNIPITCYNPKLITSNTISFNFTLNNTATSIYNVNLACTIHTFYPTNQFYPLKSNGLPDLTRNSSGTTISSGQTIWIQNWPCSYSNSNSFEGYIWINFTPAMGGPNLLNPWDSYRAFDVYIDARLAGTAYNQTKSAT